MQAPANPPDESERLQALKSLGVLDTKCEERFDRYTRLAFTFNYFVADLANDERGVLRGQLDASFDLAGPLAIVFRLNTLVEHQRGQDIGAALNVTVGLRLGYFGRLSTR